MLVGYAGKFIDGKPTLMETVTLPNNTDIIIMVELPLKNTEELQRRQKTEALKRIFIEAQEVENDLTEDEWAELENIRSQSDFNRGVEKWFTL